METVRDQLCKITKSLLQTQEEYVQKMSTTQITVRNEEQNNNRTTRNVERHTKKSEGTKCETTSKEHAR